jgi:LTXXQ motif family protein
MNHPRTIRAYTGAFLGIAAVSGVAMLAAGMLALAEPEGTARADDPGYGWGMHGDGHGDYGWHGHRGHDGDCGERTAGFLQHLDGVVPDLMNLNPDQQKAWNDLLASAETARTQVKDACAAKTDRDATAPERLARMESVMAARLDGLRAVRPKFDAFYASLSDRQREGIDDLLSHRGRPMAGVLHGKGHPPVPVAPHSD